MRTEVTQDSQCEISDFTILIGVPAEAGEWEFVCTEAGQMMEGRQCMLRPAMATYRFKKAACRIAIAAAAFFAYDV